MAICEASMCATTDWHRRTAIQIAAQLPEGAEDALLVLGYAKTLVEEFWTSPPADQGPVVDFRSGSSSPKRRASPKGNPSDLPK